MKEKSYLLAMLF